MFKGFCSPGAWRLCALLVLVSVSLTSFAASPQALLVYELKHDMLSTPDTLSVTVYEDGIALVHYPAHMTQAGDYLVELSPDEVQRIRLLAEHPLIQGFSPGQARAQKEEIDAQSGELFAISDDSHSIFEINTPGGGKSIRWANLSVDADRYPGIGVFRKLAEIEAELLQLVQHPTATEVVE
jgi:hypothetical protein